MSDLKDPSAASQCRNCGARFQGDFCSACGQAADIHRSLGAIGHDLVHGVLHVDGKIWKTLYLLAWRPGELTRRYIDGERKRFVSPVALFLFSIFLMFGAFQLSGISSPADIGVPSDGSQAARLARDEARSQDLVIGSAREGTMLVVHKTGWAWLDKGLDKWRRNPSLMLYKFQASSYKFSWLLIVISFPFVWLLFARDRRFGAYDHVVFVTYSISFMTVLMVILSLLHRLGVHPLPVAMAAVLIPPVHLYRDIVGTYGVGLAGAAWRLLALLFFIVLVVAVFLQILWLIGIAG